jgi:hypothetical protein
VKFIGNVDQVTGPMDAVPDPNQVAMEFEEDLRDPALDGDPSTSHSPIAGPTYRVSGSWVDAFGHSEPFDGYKVDLGNGFSWLYLNSSTHNGTFQGAIFRGFVTPNGSISGNMDSVTPNGEAAKTDESGQ